MCSRLTGREKLRVQTGDGHLWGFVWNMNRTCAEGGVKINKYKNNNNNNNNNKTKSNAIRNTPDIWLKVILIILLYEPNKFKIWLFFYSLKTILPVRRLTLTWDSLSGEEKVNTQFYPMERNTKKISIEIYHAGINLNAAYISVLVMETVLMMKWHLLPR